MKFHRVNTIADGYHDGIVDDLTALEFLTLFQEYCDKYDIVPEACVINDDLAWFQFHIFEEDGVALFVTNDKDPNRAIC